MFMVNIAEAKARLSEYLDAVSRGERVMICNRNRPIAELRPVEGVAAAARDLSPLFPDWQIPDGALGPLDEEDLDAWRGATASHDVLHVAEPRTVQKAPKPRKRR